jgi:hypothetical protein
VVTNNQSAFIKTRSLHDNFVLVKQVARKINRCKRSGVLLKLDLARAFDSISWSFLFEVLRHMGFGERFLKWIALLLYTANTKVMVNGSPGRRIVHARGLRQGDPTSPLLFVVGMEVMIALIGRAVQDQLLSNLANISPIQRISIFVDDVVCFFRPVRAEVEAIKQILHIFGAASGLKANYNKTTATVIRGLDGEVQCVKTILGCEIADFPIKYPGLKLALRPLTRAEWQYLLDKALLCLPAWQRGLIDRAGRLILIKAVLSARSIHQLLVEDAPVWLLEEINKWLRSFFWAGKKEVSGGQCLVAWDVVCRPTSLGGLGIKNLRLHGLALRARWQWLRRTDPDRPWQGLPPLKDAAAMEVFESLVKIEVGDGRSVLFWKDRWINGFTAGELAPLVAALVPTCRKNSRRVSDTLRGNAWIRDLSGNITVEGCIQCVRLWEKIEEVERDEQQADRYTWKGAVSGKYSARDTYSMLCHGSMWDGNHEQVWKPRVPLKCKIFIWLALRDRLWTSERRFRHGL